MPSTPSLLDFVVFFETEPEWLHPEGWFYGARFSTRRGDDHIVATIAPDEAEFSFEWWQGEVMRTRVQSVMVVGWEIVAGGGKEHLRVTYNDGRIKFCELQLKPHVQVDWSMTW